MSQASYAKSIRDAVRGLWATGIMGNFFSVMLNTVERNLSAAWFEGMAECGFVPEDITPEEDSARLNLILVSVRSISGFGSDILEAKRQDKKITVFSSRIMTWANRWNESKNMAKSMACENQKMMWVVGPTEHCSSCLKMNGKVKRASQWEESGILPQSQILECGGWRCQCELVETDAPMSRGPLPRP